MRDPNPVDTLMAVSSLLDAAETGGAVGDLVADLAGVPTVAGAVGLHLLAAMTTDEGASDLVAEALGGRTDHVPGWVTGLAETTIDGLAAMGSPDHALDMVAYYLGATVDGGHRLSAVLMVDNRAGAPVKDAYISPRPLDLVIDHVGQITGSQGSGMPIVDLDPARYRSQLVESVDGGPQRVQFNVTDTWPTCRPLVRWLVGLLPAEAAQTDGAVDAVGQPGDDAGSTILDHGINVEEEAAPVRLAERGW